MRAASSVPPVIEEISNGAFRGLPKNVVERSTSRRSSSGRARWMNPQALESGGEPPEADIFLQIDPDVIRFPLRDH
jgi:hypothetical protein